MQREEMVARIKEEVAGYEDEMIEFMRDMISIPSESCEEGEVIERIAEEMNEVGFDEVFTDEMGNVHGRVGEGDRVLAYDAHIDTVGIGNPDEWDWDPYEGKFEDGIIYGRGATDQEAAMVSMVYAGKVIKDLGLHEEFSLYFVGTVQEEDCDGLCWEYIINENVLDPELVVITEPTNLNIYRGHRGRMEMKVKTEGVSCHGSAPERGENSLYRMAKIISGVENLNPDLKVDDFLGKGTVAATHVINQTPSLNAIPNQTELHIDRRLTAGEDKELAVEQIEEIIESEDLEAEVSIPYYDTPSYTGFKYEMEKYYPTWVLDEDHPVIQSAVSAYEDVFDEEPKVDKWTFSTNGVTIMGRNNIPCVGFGPANEIYAHSVEDQVPVDHLLKAAEFYAHFPYRVE